MGALPSLSMAPLSLSAWLERLESQHPAEIELGLDQGSAVAESWDYCVPSHNADRCWYQRQG